VIRAHLRITNQALAARPARDVGLALSGGGFRALASTSVACARFADRGVLERVFRVSGVSGARSRRSLRYSDGDFAAFDQRVCELCAAACS